MSVIPVITSPAATTLGNAQNVPFAADIVVYSGVTILDEDQTGASAAIYANGDNRVIINGTLFGYAGIIVAQTSSDFVFLNLATTGSVQAIGGGYGAAIDVQSGKFSIVNQGQIQGVIYLDCNAAGGFIAGSGGGTFDNLGTISTVYNAIYNNSASGSVVHFDNSGTIIATGTSIGGVNVIDDIGGHTVYFDNSGRISASSHGVAVYTDSSTTEYFNNSGLIGGDVDLLATGSTFFNSGAITGDVNFAGPTFIDNGTVSGIVTLPGQSTAIENVTIGAGATISDGTTVGFALRINQGPFFVDNSGHIDGLAVDYTFSPFANTSGQGSIVNHGVISTQSGMYSAVYIGDTTASDTDTIDNYGAIVGDKNGSFSSGVSDGGANTLDILNSGTITGKQGVYLFGSSNINNSGGVSGQFAGIDSAAGAGATGYVFNSGTIAGDSYGILDTSGHAARNVNYGNISSGAAAGDYAVYADVLTQERLVNGGVISGAVSLGAANSTILNAGSMDGNIIFGGASGRLVNSGSVDGNISFAGAGNVYLGKGGSFTGTFTGSGADGRYYAGAGQETFDFTSSGAKLAVGGSGDTIFNYGSTFSNAMSVIGGSGTTEVDLIGNYTSANQLFLGARTMVGVDKLVLGAGSNYSIVSNAATVANGETMVIDASGVGAANTFLFDASRDVGGFYDFLGGAGTNQFNFATYNLFANDVVQGGSGASNVIKFQTAGTVTAQQFANVSGISTIKVAQGNNNIQLSDFMVAKAFNHALAVNLSTGTDTVDASLLTTASNSVIINATAASGGDTFIFGSDRDTVNFAALPTSSSVSYDIISSFNFTAGDSVSVAGYTPSSIASAASGSLSTATFDVDLAALLGPGQLGANSALLFTATGGSLAGDTFLIASTNGSAGYAAGDLVLRLIGATGTLTTANV